MVRVRTNFDWSNACVSIFPIPVAPTVDYTTLCNNFGNKGKLEMWSYNLKCLVLYHFITFPLCRISDSAKPSLATRKPNNFGNISQQYVAVSVAPNTDKN